jgi:hypothetical protein
MDFGTILRFIVEALLASGIVSILFAVLGKSWIENQFAKRLKHTNMSNSMNLSITSIK